MRHELRFLYFKSLLYCVLSLQKLTGFRVRRTGNKKTPWRCAAWSDHVTNWILQRLSCFRVPRFGGVLWKTIVKMMADFLKALVIFFLITVGGFVSAKPPIVIGKSLCSRCSLCLCCFVRRFGDGVYEIR